jgi:LCP family protein required for cell wall assembly
VPRYVHPAGAGGEQDHGRNRRGWDGPIDPPSYAGPGPRSRDSYDGGTLGSLGAPRPGAGGGAYGAGAYVGGRGYGGGAGTLTADDDPGLLTHRASFDPDYDPYGDRFGGSYGGGPDFLPPGERPGRHRRGAGGGGRPRWLKVIAWVGAVVVVLGVMTGGVAFYEYRKLSNNISRVDALALNDPSIKNAARQQNAENFLLIGSDTREGANAAFGNVTGARSDTTILAHLSPNRDKVLMISFPRDSYVDIPACRKADGSRSAERHDLFNSAFDSGGPQCTVLTVQKLTGIAVNHYVQVDFTGFQTMVDALGGVSICSPENIYDKASGLRLHTGDQVLRGRQALAYVRARKALGDGSDIGRIQRQQRFLGAMVRKASSSRLLFNPIALTRFLDGATKSLTLDRGTSLRDLKALGDQLRNLDPRKVTFLTAPIANQDYAPPGTRFRGKVLLDDVAGGRLWDSIINDKPAPPKTAPPTKPGTPAPPSEVTLTVAPTDISVRVLNGVGESGLARRTAADLTSVGFAISNTGNAPVGATASVVRYAPDRLDAARTLAAAVPGAVLQEDASLGRTLTLVIGSTYKSAVPVSAGQKVPAPKSAADTRTPPAGGGTNPPRTPPVPTGTSAADTTCTT